MTEIKVFKHGHCTMEKLETSGMYLVRCYHGTELHDKVRCDTHGQAQAHFKAFCRTLCDHPETKYLKDSDCGDWDEAIYECLSCGGRIRAELPD
jgi:hypothetical protein